jgi:DNA-directed RNA polymerase specialized sigma subunit
MTFSATLALAADLTDLPVSTAAADRELAAAAGEADLFAGPGAAGECFDGQLFPQLSNEAQCELVAYHQTTLALRSMDFKNSSVSAKTRALVAAHLAGDDERTSKLVGSVFRLVKWFIKEQETEGANQLSVLMREELFAAGYATVLEAIAGFDPERMPIFANWVSTLVEPVLRSTRQKDRLSGVLKPVELRVLRRMQVVQYRLTVELKREPTRAEIYAATRLSSVEWNTQRLIQREPALSTDEVASRVADNMKRSGEAKILSDRMDFLSQHMISADQHLEDRVLDNSATYDSYLDPALVDDGTVESAAIEHDPNALDLISFALRGCSETQKRDVTSQLGLDPTDTAPETALTHETRSLLRGVRNRLSAPHAQFCWLGAGVPGQFSQAPVATSTLVAQRVAANRRGLVTRGA